MMSKTVRQRVEDLLQQMTLEEKVAQMIQLPCASNTQQMRMGIDEAVEWAKKGTGSFLNVLGEDARKIQEAACNTRLGIPVVFGIDAVRGHSLNEDGTIFPTQLACACTWDRGIAREMGKVTAREVATDGLHWTFSPLLCLARDLRWGRVNETFGEDPYLVGELAAATIEGYQGDDLTDNESILACAKHYIAYGEATGARDAYDSEVSYRKIREVFLPPFQKAVDAGCATFMTAYGSVDGTVTTADDHLLKDILRDEMGFEGFVVTDWKNNASLVEKQYVAADYNEAAILSTKGGNDMMMNSPEFYEPAIQMVKEGKLDEALIDDAVRHILTIKFKMGLFEKPAKDGVAGCIGSQEHQAAALNAARRSITLLKNNGILPLSNDKKVALIGKNADDVRAQYGDWTYFSHPLPKPDHPGKRPYVTLKEGFEALGVPVTYAYGCGPIESEKDDLDGAVKAAGQADVIVYVVGDEHCQIGEKKDRAKLELSGKQLELFYRLKAMGKPIVTVLVASKPLAIPEVAERSDALVIAFNGGAHAGTAVAEGLYGKFNPAGRLPISFPYHSGQMPVYYNHLLGWHGKSNGQYVEGKYCDLPKEPLFTFGEGLSYTTFAYEGLTFDADTLTATVTVTNTGDREGLETVQVYFRDLVSSVLTPLRQLIAWKQVSLAPGERKEVTFQLKREDFSLVNRKEERVVEPGDFRLQVGHSAKNEDLLSIDFTL